MIRIQAAGVRTQHLRVAHEKFQVKTLRQIQRFENAFVPEARPTLIHDFGFHLRNEILRFIMNNGEQIFFPIREMRIVIANEE